MMVLTDGATEEALDSMDCWRALGDAVPDLLLLVDQEGTIRHANRATDSRSVDQLMGASVLDLVPVDLQDESAASLEEVFASGSGQARELCIKKSDGRTAWFAVHAAPVRQSSTIVASVIIARDVTEHRALESQLHAAQRLDALGHLAGGIAHDINSLLSIIILSTSLLTQAETNQQTQIELAAVLDAARRGETLTAQLLGFARHQRSELKHERKDLNATVQEFSEIFGRILGAEVELRLQLEQGKSWVYAGKGQLEQILMNLLLNARDAISGWGRITVSTSVFIGPGGRRIALAVEDNGAGMDDITRRRAFEPLFTTKGPGKGTGLGLSTVQAIAKQLGGTVSLRTEPGIGTTVEVMLPICQSD